MDKLEYKELHKKDNDMLSTDDYYKMKNLFNTINNIFYNNGFIYDKEFILNLYNHFYNEYLKENDIKE